VTHDPGAISKCRDCRINEERSEREAEVRNLRAADVKAQAEAAALKEHIDILHRQVDQLLGREIQTRSDGYRHGYLAALKEVEGRVRTEGEHWKEHGSDALACMAATLQELAGDVCDVGLYYGYEVHEALSDERSETIAFVSEAADRGDDVRQAIVALQQRAEAAAKQAANPVKLTYDISEAVEYLRRREEEYHVLLQRLRNGS
jgi:hypothetical protein